jgi:hypothetical protein
MHAGSTQHIEALMITMLSARHPRALAAGLLFLAALAGGCSSAQPIVNHWIHAHEEDSAGVRTFRPSTYDFPPSRGREGFDFRGDGTAIVYTIGPADGNLADTGRWALADRMLTITLAAAPRPQRFEVAAVDTGVLKLRVMR